MEMGITLKFDWNSAAREITMKMENHGVCDKEMRVNTHKINVFFSGYECNSRTKMVSLS